VKKERTTSSNLCRLLLRATPGAGLLIRGIEELSGNAAYPAVTAASLVAGACILLGLQTRTWAAVAGLGLVPLLIWLDGPDALLYGATLLLVALEGAGSLSLEHWIERRRERA
jgi:uncharacterized membrane protein YphA (DoxX/SURF4 family)